MNISPGKPPRSAARAAALDAAMRRKILAALAEHGEQTGNGLYNLLGAKAENRVRRLLAELVAAGLVAERLGPYRWTDCLGRPGYRTGCRLYSVPLNRTDTPEGATPC